MKFLRIYEMGLQAKANWEMDTVIFDEYTDTEGERVIRAPSLYTERRTDIRVWTKEHKNTDLQTDGRM